MQLPKFNDRDHRIKFGLGPMHWADKNKPLMWYPADTEEKFDKHWSNPQQRELLIKYGWTKDSILYKRNDLGFRMYEDMSNIKQRECDFYLGCSHTFGIGLNLEDTWGWKLSQKKGLTFVNLGWPGGSIESQYRILRSWAEKLKPKRAFTLGTYLGRREILRPDGAAERIGPWIKDGPLQIVYDRINNKNEIFISALRTLDAMRFTCIHYNIEFYTLKDSIRNEILPFDENDMTARDLLHFSPNWHSRVANVPDSYWERLA
jgi:hypothetical protein